MEKKILCLSTCSTCRTILRQTRAVKKGFLLQDIKTQKITPAELDQIKELAGSYEALFSRRALKYRQLGLHKLQLGEADYRRYLLEEYTFLKRPVIMINHKIFIGSDKKTIEAFNKELNLG
jgi:arsenate reductase (glutaredoxin)